MLVNTGTLAAALCKVEGFSYAPSAEVYWQHGHSSEILLIQARV